jgi:hypothetical protein
MDQERAVTLRAGTERADRFAPGAGATVNRERVPDDRDVELPDLRLFMGSSEWC